MVDMIVMIELDMIQYCVSVVVVAVVAVVVVAPSVCVTNMS